MALAIFDLDNTLLGGDSDYLWGQYLVELGVVDGVFYARENQRYYDAYKAGTLDIQHFLEFALRPLVGVPQEQLYTWRKRYLDQKIRPIMLPKALALLDRHRQAGDILLIITATNRFVTQPIAEWLGVEHLIATDPELVDGFYTGKVAGIPCFREGKVLRLQEWLQGRAMSLEKSWFYSDSHNDLPLLLKVANPVAVDPDDELRRYAEHQRWPVISLRN
ncbi:MAG: HAD family hydrolase [Pseudomonadota bacterium]